MNRFFAGLLVLGVLVPSSYAQQLLFEDFESYPAYTGTVDNTALYPVWKPTNGSGSVTWTSTDLAYNQAVVVDKDSFPAWTANAYPNGGKGAAHLGGYDGATNTAVLEWTGLSSANAIKPTATQNVVVEGDIWDPGNFVGNRRMSIGLRSKVPANLIELGFWNATTCDPTVLGCNTSNPALNTDGAPVLPSSQFGARTILFGPNGAPLLTAPNWQYFSLPIELNRPDPVDTLVNKADIGEGFHHFKATIAEHSVTYEIDLWRDGKRNTSKIIGPRTSDFNGNGVVDGADYVVWRDNKDLTGATPSQGDANGDTIVNDLDYEVWRSEFGNDGGRPGTPGVDATMTFNVDFDATPGREFNSLRIGGPSGLNSLESPADNEIVFDNIRLALVPVSGSGALGSGSVPEPSTFVLVMGGLAGLTTLRRRRCR